MTTLPDFCRFIEEIGDKEVFYWLLTVQNGNVAEHLATCRRCYEKIGPLLNYYHSMVCDTLTKMAAEELLELFRNAKLPLLFELHLIVDCTECCLRFFEPLRKHSRNLPPEIKRDQACLLLRVQANVAFALLDADGGYAIH